MNSIDKINTVAGLKDWNTVGVPRQLVTIRGIRVFDLGLRTSDLFRISGFGFRICDGL